MDIKTIKIKNAYQTGVLVMNFVFEFISTCTSVVGFFRYEKDKHRRLWGIHSEVVRGIVSVPLFWPSYSPWRFPAKQISKKLTSIKLKQFGGRRVIFLISDQFV